MYEPDVKKLNEEFHKKGVTDLEVEVDEMEITFY